MALPALCRRMPVLRELSVMVHSGENTPNRACTLLVMHWSSATNSAHPEKGSPTSGEAPSVSTGTATAQPGAAGTAETSPSIPASSASSAFHPTPVDDEEEWTEVVHASGQLYYWNQRTGETTQLGEPKPQGKGGSGGGGGSGGSSGSSSRGSAGSAGGQGGFGGGMANDPRAEAPLEDRTGTYAAIGILAGAFLGWVSQFV